MCVCLFNKCYHNYCVTDRVYLCTNSCVEHVEICRSAWGRKGWGLHYKQMSIYPIYHIPAIPGMQSSWVSDFSFFLCLTHVKLCTYITTTTNMRAHTAHTHTQIHKYVCIYLIWKAVLLVSAGYTSCELVS